MAGIQAKDFITLSSLLFSLSSLLLFFSGVWWAPLLLLLSVASDALDGFVARSTNSHDLFGRELDSLCDFGSFILVPTAMLLFSSRSELSIASACLFSFAGAIRLAKFNSFPDDGFFTGLTTTASGLVLALVLSFYSPFAPFFFAVLAILMLAPFRYPKKPFEPKDLGKNKFAG